MKKKLRTLLCLLLALMLLLAPATATISDVTKYKGELIMFTVANDTLLELTYSSMPVIKDGSVYLPYTFFTNNFDIRTVYDETNMGLMYGSQGKTLVFDIKNEVTYDSSMNTLAVSAIFVKGQPFVPVSFVSTYFGLNYSFVSDGPFIRVYNNSATYPDSFLGTAFKTRINEMKTSLVEENKITTPTNNTPRPPIVRNPPHDEDPLSPPVEVIIPIIDVYPAFNVSNVGRTNELLDKLAEKKIQTVFFLSTSDIISLDKLIRRIWFEGHEIGIRLGSHNILAELEEANRLLKILLKLKTRIIMLPEEIKISEDVSMLLEGQGYMIWRNNVKIIEEESVEIGHNERYLPDDEPLEGKSPDDTIGEVSIERKSYTESILEDLSATEDPKVLILDDSQETVDNISELLGSIENGHYKLRTIDSYTLPIQSVK